MNRLGKLIAKENIFKHTLLKIKKLGYYMNFASIYFLKPT